MKKTNYKKGFTLIELLVVISIIGLLSSVVLAGLTSARQKAKNTKVVAEMNQLKTALEMYRNDNGKYPNEKINAKLLKVNALNFLTTALVPKYIPSIPYPVVGANDDDADSFYYATGSTLESFGIACGMSKTSSYLLVFFNNMAPNFPKVGWYDSATYVPYDPYEGEGFGRYNENSYCIGQ